MKSTYSIDDYYKLYKLARIRTRSAEDYKIFEQFQSSLILRYFQNWNITLINKMVLDLGCGLGGFLKEFSDQGAYAVGLDLEIPNPFNAMLTRGDALFTPFEANLFDLVFCSSLIEHVANPNALVEECLRITRTGGYVYLSFPPFYSLRGGHQFAPYHLLGEKVALSAYRRHHQRADDSWIDQRVSSRPGSYADAFVNWGLYRMTIRKCENILRQFPVKIIDCSTKFLTLNFTKLPLLREFLTWHVQFLAQKL
jgi:SAM-dependent methyltransferase